MTQTSQTAGTRRAVRPVVPARAARRGVDLTDLTPTDGFWSRLQATNAAATLEHCQTWMERLGWLASFDRVADGTTGPDRPGWQFSDSEVYKLMEALAWEHARTGDPDVDGRLRDLTARIARAQDEDGYLNTCFGHPGRPGRYTDLSEGHELYCTGHLLQAAVARLRTTGPEDPLVEVARRAADHVCREFGPGGALSPDGPDGVAGICGHPEVEVALAELGRALAEPRYTEQARLFVERRGHGRLAPPPLLGPAYFQDDQPVREADVWRGHAVRALYLAAGAADVAVDTDDGDLLAAVRHQWDRTVARRTYLTGGMGSRHQDEGFGEDWELPADRAYCETCAGVASVMVSWRLYLATGDPAYADLIERTMYNVVATSPRGDGRAFFYANPLHQRTAAAEPAAAGAPSPAGPAAPEVGAPADAERVNPRAEGALRAPWFEVSCCPTNVARTLASWTTYCAAVDDGDGGTVELLQHVAGRLRVDLADGATVVLDVRTRYPEDGRVEVEVLAGTDRPVPLRLRVPGWAAGATLDTGDGPRPVPPGMVGTPPLAVGDQVALDLPVTPRLTWPDDRIDALRGCVAVERGPVVLCLESPDLPGVDLADVRLDPAAGVRDAAPGAEVTLLVRDPADAVDAAGVVDPADPAPVSPPYRSDPGAGTVPAVPPRSTAPVTAPGRPAVTRRDVRLVPYHSWAERGPATMRVFLPTSGELR